VEQELLTLPLQFKAVHIEGEHNESANALSPFQDSRFLNLAQNADRTTADITKEFFQIMSELK